MRRQLEYGNVENIKLWFQKALDHGMRDQIDWYRNAHDHMQGVSERTGVDVVIVAAVTAILSPGLSWDLNLIEAERAILLWQKGIDWTEWRSPAYGRNVQKVAEILETGDLKLVSGPKVSAFFINLFDPDDEDHVTLDRHALRVWLNEKGAGHKYISGSQMKRAAQDFKEAAFQLGLLPSEVQAVSWVAYRSFAGDIDATEIVAD